MEDLRNVPKRSSCIKNAFWALLAFSVRKSSVHMRFTSIFEMRTKHAAKKRFWCSMIAKNHLQALKEFLILVLMICEIVKLSKIKIFKIFLKTSRADQNHDIKRRCLIFYQPNFLLQLNLRRSFQSIKKFQK